MKPFILHNAYTVSGLISYYMYSRAISMCTCVLSGFFGGVGVDKAVNLLPWIRQCNPLLADYDYHVVTL